MAGRFAPSPTGLLHFGSLVTALASQEDAHAHGLPWFVRMEDLDPPRAQPGADLQILQQLKDFGLVWDADPTAQTTHGRGDSADGVVFQSDRHSAYLEALEALMAMGLIYACTCSRRTLQAALDAGETERGPSGEIRYPGTCRHAYNLVRDIQDLAERTDGCPPEARPALRFAGPLRANQQPEDDFVVMRADRHWAYHLAVVVDDAASGITRIVRGADLASVLNRHRALQRALSLPQPVVLHVPTVLNPGGDKLSKQTGAEPICARNAQMLLRQARDYLAKNPLFFAAE